MDFFWTDTAERQYLKHSPDAAARKCFDDLLTYIEEDPGRGREIKLLELSRYMEHLRGHGKLVPPDPKRADS